MTEIDKEISEMKLCLNGRGRISAVEFLKNVRILLVSIETTHKKLWIVIVVAVKENFSIIPFKENHFYSAGVKFWAVRNCCWTVLFETRKSWYPRDRFKSQ